MGIVARITTKALKGEFPIEHASYHMLGEDRHVVFLHTPNWNPGETEHITWEDFRSKFPHHADINFPDETGTLFWKVDPLTNEGQWIASNQDSE